MSRSVRQTLHTTPGDRGNSAFSVWPNAVPAPSIVPVLALLLEGLLSFSAIHRRGFGQGLPAIQQNQWFPKQLLREQHILTDGVYITEEEA